jgi:endogenous inhibitor of DNA gyrase (YacG/DUF329 family)
MPYVEDDDEGEELDERELPDQSDSNEDENTRPCPHCGKEIYDNAEQCPKCGKYVDDDSSPRRPVWLIIGVILCLLIVIGWVLLKI